MTNEERLRKTLSDLVEEADPHAEGCWGAGALEEAAKKARETLAATSDSDMEKLEEWLRQQAEQEGDVMRNFAMCDKDDRRTAAGIRAGYKATIRHIRTEFLGEEIDGPKSTV